jgi:hypothetical protein
MSKGIRHSSYDRPKGLLAGPMVKIYDPCKAAHVFVITKPKLSNQRAVAITSPPLRRRGL